MSSGFRIRTMLAWEKSLEVFLPLEFPVLLLFWMVGKSPPWSHWDQDFGLLRVLWLLLQFHQLFSAYSGFLILYARVFIQVFMWTYAFRPSQWSSYSPTSQSLCLLWPTPVQGSSASLGGLLGSLSFYDNLSLLFFVGSLPITRNTYFSAFSGSSVSI